MCAGTMLRIFARPTKAALAARTGASAGAI
jgi:hypothetical protein